MSQEVKPRTIEDVQKDYNMQAAMLGDITYKMKVLESDAQRMQQRLHELNAEAIELNKPKQEAAHEDAKS